jgi:cell division protein FtsL
MLLVGVVALNVAVLRTNMHVSKLDKLELQLRAENQALQSQVSSAASAQRIESTARTLGLVPAPATDTSYLDLGHK